MGRFSVLQQIEKHPDGDSVEFAFTVLTCDEETVRKLSEGIDNSIRRYKEDGQHHDIFMSLKVESADDGRSH